MLATTRGKEYALEQLRQRREANKGKEEFDNSKLPAGSPMIYHCLSCGARITVPESWTSKPDLCPECVAMKTMGWLE